MHEDYTATYAIARFVAFCGWLTVLVGGGVLAFGLYGFTLRGLGAQQAAIAGSVMGLAVLGLGLLLVLWGQLTRIRDNFLKSYASLTLLMVIVTYSPVPAQAQTQPDGSRLTAWPARWTNPITGTPGGTVAVTGDWGALSLGCRGAPTSPKHAFYERTGTRQHLGLDIRAKNPRNDLPPLTPMSRTTGTSVYAISNGRVIKAGYEWLDPAAMGQVLFVEHSSASETFTAAYGHIAVGVNPQTRQPWKTDDEVMPGDLLGLSYPIREPHLHFGVMRGSHGHVYGRSDAIVNADGTCADNIRGTVDPIPYLERLRPAQAGATACTNLLNRNTAVPDGYGSPVNLFANDRNLLFEAVCRGGNSVEILAGHNYPEQFTYRYGYRWTGQQWQRFAFTGADRQGDWVVGRATAEIDRQQLNATGNNWIVGYSCWRLPSGQWRCGCADTACARGTWHVQGFRLEPQSAAGSWNAVAGTWRGNVMQPGAPRYTTTFRVDATGPGARCGTIDYPELRCGGELRNCRLNNGVYLFEEALTYGRLQCIANGTIAAEPRGNQLDWKWTYSTGRVGSTALLTRQ
jgi:murein DD-endopeptidase MepM/ murein hydrolase activator NlpD